MVLDFGPVDRPSSPEDFPGQLAHEIPDGVSWGRGLYRPFSRVVIGMTEEKGLTTGDLEQLVPMKKKTITIEVTAEEVDALEDIFFTKLSTQQREERHDAKLSLWKKIATAFDYDEKEAEGR